MKCVIRILETSFKIVHLYPRLKFQEMLRGGRDIPFPFSDPPSSIRTQGRHLPPSRGSSISMKGIHDTQLGT